MKPANFDGKRFWREGHAPNSLRDMLKWQMSGKRQIWPRWIENRVFPPPPPRVEGRDLSLTWIGHSTVLIQTAGLNILTDPLFSMRASPSRFIGPKRVREPGLAIDGLPEIDIVLVSHNHYDHMDLPGLRSLARRHTPHIVTPLGNARHIRKASRRFTIDELDWGASLQAKTARITLVPALHWSKRGFSDTNRSLWGAFVIETDGGVVYFAGDTGYGDGSIFHDIRRHFGPPRLSLLPIGAYEPRWFMQFQHMNPDDAVRAHLNLASRKTVAIHHSTIQLTDEALVAPAQALRQALLRHDVDPASFLAPDVGETINLG